MGCSQRRSRQKGIGLKQIVIYTDGACSGNPGPGGWGAVLIYGTHKLELSGFEPRTTNNRMELTAPIQALSRLKEPCSVKLYSDSSYLVNAFRLNWLEKWENHDWIRSNKKPVENRDLWEKLIELTRIHQVDWIKVKGHADDVYNNRCDELATGEIRKHRGDE